MYREASKPFTSQANRTDSLEGSNLVMFPAPDRPSSRLAQGESTSVPTGVTSPRPVTTTRWVKLFPDLLVQVVHGVADGPQLLGLFIGDVDVELLLDGHDELDRVETVGAEVFQETRIAGELL